MMGIPYELIDLIWVLVVIVALAAVAGVIVP
jgi:hypothetical protein